MLPFEIVDKMYSLPSLCIMICEIYITIKLTQSFSNLARQYVHLPMAFLTKAVYLSVT